ncbi:amino acid ABC transporter permease [Nitriliruptor alkaliphilus]|uniref:amino acid ABC transporter permease n=1 Tax=Nitriliruptor alkaliphilus TaxID=427918 RepID=UPI0006976E93|nr:amino acid ABC transporter permease [Nitriliruptor alkaliphilus]
MSTVLVEELGPRGKRRVRTASIISLVLLAVLIGFILRQLYVGGQFEARLWAQFVDFETGWPQFLITGLWGTFRAAIGAIVIALVLGLALALGRLSRLTPLRVVCGVVIDVFRGPPVLLMIFFAYYALPQILPGGLGTTISRNPLIALVIGLAAYNTAVLAEIFRAGILSLDRGQSEAAYTVGMTHSKAMRLVILPQALRRMIPAIVAQLATLTKDTALGYIITVTDDLMGRGRSFVQGSPINDLQTWFVVGILYFIIVWMLTRLARRLEVQQRRKLGAGAIAVGGEADLDALAEEVEADEPELHQGGTGGAVDEAGAGAPRV